MLSVKAMQAVVVGLDSARNRVLFSFWVILNPPYFAQYKNAEATAVLDFTMVGSGRYLKTDIVIQTVKTLWAYVLGWKSQATVVVVVFTTLLSLVGE